MDTLCDIYMNCEVACTWIYIDMVVCLLRVDTLCDIRVNYKVACIWIYVYMVVCSLEEQGGYMRKRMWTIMNIFGLLSARILGVKFGPYDM